MSDTVNTDELRKAAHWLKVTRIGSYSGWSDAVLAAAEEIDRLRAENAVLRNGVEASLGLEAENNRLRDSIQEAYSVNDAPTE